ncbi:FAD-binding oxidoreductase [Seohaeicola saemankumensis]|uniref:FAD-binding oxidoreductase n=1 Tax=Seohaeicola saemankumensis TaxID=481181 RepID=UPI001E4BE442|nr:FAD-binding oxidoreductase [Seohaeicola saemankumensis]MCD1625424.1 FAD-binding oxidoreductase [Seohaeicola saemankumensis]
MTLNPATPDLARALRDHLPERAFREVTPAYLEEPRGRWAGHAGLVIAPETVDQVATVMRAANDARIGVLPYGGGTGLVGGQIMPDGPAPLLLSLERMTAIRAVYPEENVLIAEAGAILSDIHDAALAVNRLFPLSIAAKGSARIGGNLATNAGGVNVLRYGNARDLCLGLEVVFADGRIWNGLSRLRKDNTGYDLRNLMIGSEGTLGIITATSLKLVARPADEGTAMLVVDSPAAAITMLAMARDMMGEGVSAFELIHANGLHFLTETLPDIRQPFDTAPEWMVLIDVGLADGLNPAHTLETLFERGFEAGLLSDGIIAQNETQRHQLWEVREQIPEANRRVGSVSSHDISLPTGLVPEYIARADALIAGIGDFRINCFGHLGDGNLHYNVFPQKGRTVADHLNQRDHVKHALHDLVHEMGGSVSAEHGIGRLKIDDLERYADPVKLALMRQIKDMFDPNGILNPGAVLRQV